MQNHRSDIQSEGVVKHHALLIAAAFLTVAAGCGVPLGPEQDLSDLPRFEIVDMDCQLSATECAIILGGINYLKVHANPLCKIMGTQAEERYDALSGEGFRARPPYGNYDMSVSTPSDGYTNVYPKFWTSGLTDAQSTGALLAHEEAHHLGFGENYALSAQETCLNSQA